MGFRFRKSVKIIPGVRLNLSKSGVSKSIGGRGATINLSKRGTRHTVGIPGSSLSFSSFTPKGEGGASAGSTAGGNTGAGCGCLILIALAVLMLAQCGKPSETTPAGEFDNGTSIITTDGKSQTRQVASGDALHYSADDTVYVTATNGLKGRSEPSTGGSIVGRFARGDSARVVDRSGDWLKVATAAGATAWIASRYVGTSPPARPQAQPLMSRPRPKHSPRGPYGGMSCPCSGSHVCIGPRGGRFCITSGGNKRYGV